MKDFVARIQKDLTRLQTTIEQEGDDLIKKIRALTDKKKIEKARHDLEGVLHKKLQSFEPAIKKFITAIEQNAAKAGIDVKAVEKKVRTTADKARAKITTKTGTQSRATATTKKTAKKAAVAAKPVAKAKTAVAAKSKVGAKKSPGSNDSSMT